MAMNMKERVEQYIRLRDLKAELDAAHKEKIAKVKEKMDQIEADLLAYFEEAGMESVKTAMGTAYKQRRTNSSIADWDVFLKFVIKHELWNMLERRVAKAAVEEYREEHKELPPGVNYAAEFVVNVRR